MKFPPAIYYFFALVSILTGAILLAASESSQGLMETILGVLFAAIGAIYLLWLTPTKAELRTKLYKRLFRVFFKDR